MASEASTGCTVYMEQDQLATRFHYCGLHKKARQKMLPTTTKETGGRWGFPKKGRRSQGLSQEGNEEVRNWSCQEIVMSGGTAVSCLLLN